MDRNALLNAILTHVEERGDYTVLTITVHCEGRATIEYATELGQAARRATFYLADDGAWAMAPRLMAGLAYCRPENENGRR